MAGTSAQVYNSWWQVRSDAWSRLDEASSQLEGAAPAGQPPGGLLEIISGLLDSVAPLERYWAFPGPEAGRRARDLFASGSYERFASLVARVSRGADHRVLPGWRRVVRHRRARPGRPGRDHDRAGQPAAALLRGAGGRDADPGPGTGPARGGAWLAQAR